MTVLFVVENPKQWPLDIPGTEIVAAREYLTDPRFIDLKRARVFNVCRSYAYQALGYYVSLLAAARGHKPLPSVRTIQEMRQSSLLRVVSEDLEAIIQRALGPLHSEEFTLSIYFGRNMAKRYDRLCQALFNHFPSPLMRAEFNKEDRWRLRSLRVIGSTDIPENHLPFVVEQAQRFFQRPRIGDLKRPRYEMAILFDPEEVDSPSDERAIQRFVRAAKKLGIRAATLSKDELGRIPQFDALFIRETTSVDHHTFRFATRAEAEGLVVIDDAESIIRCSNKVYQAELFERYDIPSPKTMIVHRENAGEVGQTLSFPCVLKRPDSSFSAGVVKARDETELQSHLAQFFELSELIVAQEYVESSFDWRIGVLDSEALFACKYHMARGHWQIQKAREGNRRSYGKVETLPIDQAPKRAVEIATRAASFIGTGLYGVDIKEANGHFLVMEVNDNPNIEAGEEDRILKDELYLRIMRHFFDRLEKRGVTDRAP